MEKLKITNYDNFKDASVFIREYFEAERRMKEICDFFQSFYMSKLVKSEDIYKMNPSFISLGEYENYDSWCDHILDHEVFTGFATKVKYKAYKKNNREIDREHVDKIRDTISMMVRNQWSCYFVFDKDNVLHEFVPVEAKDTIKVIFDEKTIKITGYYYTGFQERGDFSQPEESITKVTKTIFIDPSNNNVIDVKTNTEYANTIKLNSKKVDLRYKEIRKHAYSHSVDTFDYVNPYKVIRDYIESKYANYYEGYERVLFHSAGHRTHQGPIYIAKDKKEIDSIFRDIIKKYKDIYKEAFGKDLTKSDLDRYKTILWTRDKVIAECYKKHPEEFEDYEEDGIPEEDFPLVKWYRISTKKFILEE
jgi:hypothetical protein